MTLFELIMVVSLTVVLPIAIVKLVLEHKRLLREAEREAHEAQGALTAGELKRLLRDVVEEANAPILRRLDMLEQAALPPYEPEAEAPGEDATERTMGRRTP